jgi:hypothetical protein
MKNIKEEALLWVQLGSFVAIWVAILYATGTGLTINWEAIKKLPDVITVYVVLLFVFTKWLWRLPVLQGWLVPFPDLQGTWQGELRSTWKVTLFLRRQRFSLLSNPSPQSAVFSIPESRTATARPPRSTGTTTAEFCG